MGTIFVITLGLILSSQSVFSYSNKECNSFKYALDGINNLLNDEAYDHRFSWYGVQNTYYERANHILQQLNKKINSRQDNRPNRLDDAILAKSKQFGIEKIGLEDSVTRFEKLMNFQEDRYHLQFEKAQEATSRMEQHATEKIELQEQLQDLNNTIRSQAELLKQRAERIKQLGILVTKLETKVNANAPSIHGSTGQISGGEVVKISTTEKYEEITIKSTTKNATDSPNNNSTSTGAGDEEIESSIGGNFTDTVDVRTGAKSDE